jgi:hypothetical protein
MHEIMTNVPEIRPIRKVNKKYPKKANTNAKVKIING